MEGTFFGSWSHYPRYSWSILCWILLHLFPKIHRFHWRLLFSSKQWMVNNMIFYLGQAGQENNRRQIVTILFLFFSRFQSLNLTHVPEHSQQIYEFRWAVVSHATQRIIFVRFSTPCDLKISASSVYRNSSRRKLSIIQHDPPNRYLVIKAPINYSQNGTNDKKQ